MDEKEKPFRELVVETADHLERLGNRMKRREMRLAGGKLLEIANDLISSLPLMEVMDKLARDREEEREREAS